MGLDCPGCIPEESLHVGHGLYTYGYMHVLFPGPLWVYFELFESRFEEWSFSV